LSIDSPAVSIQNLNYSIDGVEILQNIDFSIYRGDYMAIVGPNGGGKSTLVNTFLGLRKDYRGEIKLFGTPLQKFRDWSKIGFVPQRATEVDQKFPITVYEVVQLGRVRSFQKFWKSRKEDKKIIKTVMDQLGIYHLKDKLIGELSGGERQRVMISRALVSQPQLLVLDEPNSGVDKKTQQEFYSILKNLNRENGITIVFVTHDIEMIQDSINSTISINREMRRL
jgi:zinc transport system ATP-binding protein